MREITARQALREKRYAVVTRGEPCRVYDLYDERDVAERICRDINARYGDLYEVAHIDACGACGR